jgi:hypothetical protein
MERCDRTLCRRVAWKAAVARAMARKVLMVVSFHLDAGLATIGVPTVIPVWIEVVNDR